MLIISNLSKTYGTNEKQVYALYKVNLKVSDSEFVAITGSSGSGKSSLLHMIAGVDVSKPYEAEQKIAFILSGQDKCTYSIINSEQEICQEEAEIQGFQYLMLVLIILLGVICICSNFVVSWTCNNTRRKEFATLMSIGMKPCKIREMRWLEQSFVLLRTLIPSILIGVLCNRLIYILYATEYAVTWSFPWSGIFLSIGILSISFIITELAVWYSSKNWILAELVRIDEI